MWRAGVLLGWVAGVAAQLQQAALWPMGAYVATMAIAVGVLLGAWRWHRAQGWMRMALGLLVGGLLGVGLTGLRAAHFAADALDPALQGVDIQVTGRIASLPQRSAQGERFDFVVESATRLGRALPVPPRLQLAWYGRPDEAALTHPGLRAGERWRFTVRLRSPHGNANPHGFDRERWLWEQGIQATGYVRNGPRDPVPSRLGATWWHPIDRLRQAVAERIEARVQGDPRSAGVLAALVVGDQSAIDLDSDIEDITCFSPCDLSFSG